jgi:outer membrane protein OmpA-like peptidoglycan-associated protein
MDDGKRNAGRALTVNGAKGEFLRGVETLVFPVPDPRAIKNSLQGTADSPGLETGAKLNNILFSLNSSIIEKSSNTELDKWVKFLKGRPEIRVELSGYTDSSGDDQFNMKLSMNRAKAIADYLVSKHIDGLRITTKGYGETMPVASNKTKAGRKKNRRVEIKFINR